VIPWYFRNFYGKLYNPLKNNDFFSYSHIFSILNLFEKSVNDRQIFHKGVIMKRVSLSIFATCLLFTQSPALADIDQYRLDSRAMVKNFFGSLKKELVAGLKEGGPVHAIPVCNEKAPEIARKMSQADGWSVGRTSLRLRNPNNAPDAWELMTLNSFEARKIKGEDLKKMEFSEIVTENGQKRFRYMKAIPTAAKPCLSCHGAKIDPKVEAVLNERYPTDKARGYKAGDIRGAFTISFPVN
jgi:hypothetical protein